MTTKLTQKELKELFDYHPDGYLIWKPRKGNNQFNKAFANTRAGTSGDYPKIEIYGISYGAHRLIYAWHTGEWPEIVDHVDKNPRNAKIGNLRAATSSQNSCNQKVRVDNFLGIKNISQRPNGTYQVRITIKGKQYSGSKKTLEEAIEWRDSKLKELHGEFASRG